MSKFREFQSNKYRIDKVKTRTVSVEPTSTKKHKYGLLKGWFGFTIWLHDGDQTARLELDETDARRLYEELREMLGNQ